MYISLKDENHPDTKEQQKEIEEGLLRFESHKWVEEADGYATCEYCGGRCTSVMPLNIYDYCPENKNQERHIFRKPPFHTWLEVPDEQRFIHQYGSSMNFIPAGNPYHGTAHNATPSSLINPDLLQIVCAVAANPNSSNPVQIVADSKAIYNELKK